MTANRKTSDNGGHTHWLDNLHTITIFLIQQLHLLWLDGP